MLWAYILILVVILFLIYIFITYNKFVSLDNKVKEAFSTMDVYLKKRWDLIPNIVDTVKGYADYEKETLENVVSLRSGVYDNMSYEDKLKTNEKLNESISKMMILSESYPSLQASENFLDLSNKLTMVEDEIAQSRKYYNAVVRIFNNKVEMFPSNIIAKLFRYKKRRMFEANNSERENVKVEL